jgi:hypothetical protein
MPSRYPASGETNAAPIGPIRPGTHDGRAAAVAAAVAVPVAVPVLVRGVADMAAGPDPHAVTRPSAEAATAPSKANLMFLMPRRRHSSGFG